MGKLSFDHINIKVGKNNKTLDFLRDALGFKDGYRPPFSFAGNWLYLGQQAVIHSISNEDANGLTQFGHIAFRSEDDTETIIDKIKSLGLEYSKLSVPESEEKQIFVNVDGLTIEIITSS